MIDLRRMQGFLWRQLGRVSFRVKVMGIAVGSVVLLGLGVTLHMGQVAQQITDEMLVRQGRAIARWVSTRSVELVLTENTFALHQLLQETMESEPSVRYIYIISRDGRVIDHTFGLGFPRGLSLVNPLEPGTDAQWVKIDTNEGTLWDVAVPLHPDGTISVHVGVNPGVAEGIVRNATVQHLVATGLVAGFALVLAFAVTGLPTRAVRELLQATEAVASGQWGRKAQVWAEDELGKLALAFNAMSQRLAEAYRAMEKRNQQLSQLNRLGMHLMGGRDESGLLVTALRGAMELVGATGGRIWAGDGPNPMANLAVGHFDPGSLAEVEAGLDVARRQERATCVPTHSGQWAVLVPMAVEGRVLGVMELVTDTEVDREDLSLTEVAGQQAGMALINARLWRDLEERESVRRHLLARVITVQEEERKRIAREIHDEASQSLARLLLEIDAMMLVTRDEPLVSKLRKVREFAVSTLGQLHSLAVELRPSVLDEVGLVSAISRYLESFREGTGLAVDFQAIGVDGLRLLSPVEIAIYRIVQEACLNVARHAKASYVSVLMERKGDEILVIIEDDGVGFDIDATRKAAVEDRLGILGMQERANLIGAELTIESWPGTGTTIYLRVPIGGNTTSTWEEN